MTIINWPAYRKWKAGATSISKLDQIQRFLLQKWLVDNLNCLMDDILIIHTDLLIGQEVSKRFQLHGIDKAGNVVILAFELSGSPEDSLLSGLKLAGYYALITSDNIISIYGDYLKSNGNNNNAYEVVKEFLGPSVLKDKLNFGNTQRIILMAEKFDKSYTALAFYLMNCGVTIDNYVAIPYLNNENLSLRLEKFLIDKDSILYNVAEI